MAFFSFHVYETRTLFVHVPLLVMGVTVILGLLLALLYITGAIDADAFASLITTLLIVAILLILLTFGAGLVLRSRRQIAFISDPAVPAQHSEITTGCS